MHQYPLMVKINDESTCKSSLYTKDMKIPNRIQPARRPQNKGQNKRFSKTGQRHNISLTTHNEGSLLLTTASSVYTIC